MPPAGTPTPIDVVVIGGGQSGLAAGYHLRRTGREFVILDAETAAGGSWQHYWDSLRLFSPAEHSSLPGRPMPPWSPGFPRRPMSWTTWPRTNDATTCRCADRSGSPR